MIPQYLDSKNTESSIIRVNNKINESKGRQCLDIPICNSVRCKSVPSSAIDTQIEQLERNIRKMALGRNPLMNFASRRFIIFDEVSHLAGPKLLVLEFPKGRKPSPREREPPA